jgi:hypothetical protein
VKPSALIAQLQGTRLHAIETEIVTQARCDAIANARRYFQLDASPSRYAMPNPMFPWAAPAALDAPGYDCTELDKGRLT